MKTETTEATAKQASTGNGNMAAGTNTKQQKATQSSKSTDKDPLQKFFIDALKDIMWAEKAIIEALPKMRDAATTDELKEAFEDHELQTRKHVSRLEKAFGLLGMKPDSKKCDAMAGILKEGDEIKNSTPEGSMTRDAALIIAAQKVEHYEIASYGGLVQLALTLDHEEIADLLERTLQEEEDTDHDLTDIAESFINFEAAEEDAEDVEGEE